MTKGFFGDLPTEYEWIADFCLISNFFFSFFFNFFKKKTYYRVKHLL